jgi:NAD(P)-dependent dehydrogenase (short-subunit alcohol dehydrogenase family)
MAPDRARVALVTGGTRGLGAAVTTRLAAQGVIVAATYRSDVTAAKELETRIDAPAGLSLHQVDVSDPEQCRGLVADVLSVHGRLDHLINNAGSLTERRLADITSDDFEGSLRTNLTSAFVLAQAAIAAMRQARFGRIVNVGSVTAVMGSPFQIDYAAAKAGLVGLTRSLARTVARAGITVNCVLPGGFATDLLDDLTLTDRAAIEGGVPVGRFGLPAEFAHVVASLLHDDAAYVTGSVIVVDGGLSIGE